MTRLAPSMTRVARFVGAFGLVALVAGCATPSPPPVTAPAPSLPNFWSGRFAVTYTEAGYQPREERSSGRFSLLAEGDRRELELSSPLGQTMAQVTLDSGEALLVASDGRQFRATSAEALTEQAFGWRVPIGDLPRWLAGRVDRPTQRENGRVVAGTDGQWSVRFEAFDGERPRRLSLEWPGARADGARRLELKLVVDNVGRVAGDATQ
ncbi:MAG TPA: outer membrane lipoprotein LolB [Zeimonas sp.]